MAQTGSSYNAPLKKFKYAFNEKLLHTRTTLTLNYTGWSFSANRVVGTRACKELGVVCKLELTIPIFFFNSWEDVPDHSFHVRLVR